MLSYLLYDLMQRKSLISTKFTLHLFIQAVNKRLPTVCMHGVKYLGLYVNSCCLVIHLYLTVCDPMNGSMPGFPVFHCLLEFAQTRPLSQWYHSIISSSVIPFSSCLQSFSASGSFHMSQFFASGGQSIGASATASVLPMNIQGWFPLGLTSLISLLSERLSRVFSSTTVWKHQFFGTQPFFLWSTSVYDCWENCSFD